MPFVRNEGAELYYRVGGGDADETVVFIGNAGFGAWQWAWQAPAIAGPYRVIVPESRGCGRSDAVSDSVEIATLIADVDVVLSDAGAGSVHLVAGGLGGLIALAYAHRSSRVRSIGLLGSAATTTAFDTAKLHPKRSDPDRVRRSLRALLSEGFRESHPDAVDQIIDWRCTEDASPEDWAVRETAFRGLDLTDRLYEIDLPVLALHGTADAVCPPEAGRRLVDQLPHGEFVEIDGAGHLVGVEAARPVNDRLIQFFPDVQGG